MSYTDAYLEEVKAITDKLDHAAINKMIDILVEIRENKGRIFFWAWAAAPAIPATLLMTLEKLQASNHTLQQIMSPN